MICQSTSKFRFIDRNYNKILVFIPGWATDYRIFHFLDMPYNYVFPINFSPVEFKKDFGEYMESRNIKEVSILGFSLGGFIAEEFVSLYPGKTDKLFLVGIRKKYKNHEIEQTMKALKKDRIELLHRFYSLCIPGKKQGSFWRSLFRDYRRLFSLQELIKTLLYLGEREIKPENIRHVKKITLFHGEHDKIAPLNESLEIKNSLKNAEIKIIKNTGHFPFSKENKSYFYE
ncbi:MAG: alpha/beta hydrolase [Candidatus Omnitrophica bacterium]|nr:alpha/beta hydrolase [Candidatus Omnitrophota bacterium]